MTWRTQRLVEVATLRTGKLDSNAAVPGGEYPFFTCAQETYQINEFAFDTEAVLLGGNNAAGIFPLKYYSGQFNAYQRTYVIETRDDDILSTRYLYFALRPALEHFKSVSIGAATQYLTKGILDNFEIALPPIEVQREISARLSMYDDLIANNKRRIELLEQSARLLFREWFDYLRYPGHEHYDVIDGVPEGWARTPLFEVASATYGYAFKSKLFTEVPEGVPVVRIRDVLRGRSSTYTVETCSQDKLLSDGDLLIGMDGDFHMNFWSGGPAWLNQRVVRIEGRDEVGTGFLRYALETPIRHFDETITGTTVAHLGASHLRRIEILLPTTPILERAVEYFDCTRQQIVRLEKMINKLAQARDLLLPRLMDGRISV